MLSIEEIDSIATGRRADPHRYLPALNKDGQRLFEIAKREGFVVRWSQGHRHHHLYWHWCDARNIPYMVVRQGAKYAGISYNSDTTGYPPTCVLTDEDLERIVDLYRAHWKARDSNAAYGATHLGIWGIPNATAVKVARLIWDVVRPRIRPRSARLTFSEKYE